MSEDAETAPEAPASTRSPTCPFCKESVRISATKCPHCQASIEPPPDHGGECPFCKEEINLEAVRCPHCKSDIAGSPPVEVSIQPATTSVHATSAGCSECGSAAPVIRQLRPGFVSRVIIGPPTPGLSRYCIKLCPYDEGAGPEAAKCWYICVDLPDRGPVVASIGR